MLGAHAGVAFDHPERLPASFQFDGFEVDPAHDAVRGPMVSPIMDAEVRNPGATAGRLVRFLDRTAAGELVGARVRVGLPEAVQEHPSLPWRAALDPEL